MRRLRHGPLWLVLAALAACSPNDSLSGAAAGWNVVLISVDTLRADRLGAYGYESRETSPRTDTLLLDAGVTFERAIAPRGATWPSMASVLTGLYPSGHGVIRNGYGFPNDVQTLPLILREAGYQTGAFLNNMHKANHRGWDEFTFESGNEGRLVAKAREWLGELEPDRPFFLWAHFFGPHSPYHVAKLLGEEIPGADPAYDGPVKMGKVALDRILRDEVDLDASDLAQLDAFYDAAVLATDLNVGRLVDALRTAPRAERTLFVFLSDHGEELYEHHRYLYHACSIYETVLHVPLAITAEGLLDAGGRVEGPVELIDVLPTLLDLLDIEQPTEQHGVSLVPQLARPTSGASRPAYSQYDDTAIRTILDGHWKLVLNPEQVEVECVPGAPNFEFPIGEVELYDLASDPGETRNLAFERPEKVRELRRMIRERFAGLSERTEEQAIPEELRRELEALGYVAN